MSSILLDEKEHSELKMIDTESAMSIDSAAADFDTKPDAPVASPSPDVISFWFCPSNFF